jgi:hypothetical protein
MMQKKTIGARRKPAREELRDLDLEILFMEGVTRRDPFYIEALQILGDDYTRRGRFQDGLRIDQRLALPLPARRHRPLQSGLQLLADAPVRPGRRRPSPRRSTSATMILNGWRKTRTSKISARHAGIQKDRRPGSAAIPVKET